MGDVGGRAVHAVFVPTVRGMRLRVSADDWERLSLPTGARVEVGLPSVGLVPYFVRSVTFVEPCWQWAVLDAAPALPQRRTG